MEIIPIYTHGYSGSMAMLGENFEESASYLPTSPTRATRNEQVAVIVRRDVYDAYGQEITTYDEYVQFLAFAKKHAPDAVPGRIPTNEYLHYYNTTPLLNLYLPQHGLYPVDEYLAGFLNICVDDNGRFVQAEQEPAFYQMLQDVQELERDGLVRFTSTEAAWPKEEPGFASALIYTSVYSGKPFWDSFGIRVDATGYHMSLLYPNHPLQSAQFVPKAYIVCGKGAQPQEFLRFLEELYSNLQLYTRFVLGEENVDYALDSLGAYTPIKTGLNYTEWEYLAYFRMDAFDKQVPRAGLPLNYYDALEKQTFAQGELYSRLRKIQAELSGEEMFSSSSYAKMKKDRMTAVYNIMTALARKQKISQESLKAWPDASALLGLLENAGN